MARKPKRLKDRIDGYEPRELSEADPWALPVVREQMTERVKERKDAEGGGNEQANWDGFVNTLTGIGDWSRDKTFGGNQTGPMFQVQMLAGTECKNRWRGSDLGGRVVETIPDEMTREGWGVTVQPSDGDDDPEEDKTDAFPPKPGAPGAPGALAGGEGGPKPGLPQDLALHPLFAQQSPAAKVKPLEVDDESTEQQEAIEGKLEELGALDAFWEALCYERAYGGAAILVGAQDGMDDPSKPLDEKRIDDVTHLTVLRGGWDGECVAWSYYQDMFGKKYGVPETYMVRNLGVPIAKLPTPGQKLSNSEILPPQHGPTGYGPTINWVHESRLLVFPGVAVDRYARTQMRGWGDSVFVRCNEVLSQFNQTWGGVANLMTDFSQGILSIKGLTAALMANNKTSNGTQLVMKKAQSLNISRSVARMMLIDAEEKFERSTVSLGGLPELLQQFALRLAAAADMPVALLMGQAPAGLNATGASDIRFFYDRVASRQRKRMLPQLRRLVSLLLKAKNGPTEGNVPSRWDAKMKPLYQLSAVEKSQIYAANTTADVANVTAGIATAEEVAATRYAGSEYNDGPIVLDLEGRKQMADQDEADKAARAKMLLAASKEAGDDKVKEKEAKEAQLERMKNGEPEPGAPPADGSGGGQPGTKPGDESGSGSGGKIEIHVKTGKGDTAPKKRARKKA